MAGHPRTRQSQSHVKQNNLRLILETIIRHEPVSRADIVRLTHVSKPTASALIEELMGRGIISEIGPGESSGGRKPILLRFESRRKHLLAFEMGRAGFRVAVSDLKGCILRKATGDFPLEASLTQRLHQMRLVILQLMAEAGIKPANLLKIVYIAPGIYVEKGKSLKWTTNMQRVSRPDVNEFFRSVFHKEIMIQHSTKLSLLGEKIAGLARDFENVVYIDFAYGLGCSIMINGQIYFGTESCAGEIGYFYSSLQDFHSGAMRPYELGSLEKRISGSALALQGQTAAKQGSLRIDELAGGSADKITAKTLFDAFRHKNSQAAGILKKSFAYFNMALCNVINLLAPELVILGGGFSGAGSLLLELIVDQIQDKVLINPKIEVSQLHNEASIIGGIQFLIDSTDYLAEL